jgi:hypothetical protein
MERRKNLFRVTLIRFAFCFAKRNHLTAGTTTPVFRPRARANINLPEDGSLPRNQQLLDLYHRRPSPTGNWMQHSSPPRRF